MEVIFQFLHVNAYVLQERELERGGRGGGRERERVRKEVNNIIRLYIRLRKKSTDFSENQVIKKIRLQRKKNVYEEEMDLYI